METVRSLLCVGEWLKGGLIKDKEMVRWLKNLKDMVEPAGEDEDDITVTDGWDAIM